jgi:hypothetical protein
MAYQVTTGIQVCQGAAATLPTVMSGIFTITSNAVSASDGLSKCGFSAAATAAKTGRMTITLHRAFKRVVVAGAVLQGPDDTAFGNTNANTLNVRNVGTQTLYVQGVLASSGADAAFADGSKVHLTLIGFDA